jgi:transcriptional regulator with XRE-family HTH domain
MTKNEMRLYRQRRIKIIKLAKTLSQAEIARRLGMKRQRVHQIIRNGS